MKSSIEQRSEVSFGRVRELEELKAYVVERGTADGQSVDPYDARVKFDRLFTWHEELEIQPPTKLDRVIAIHSYAAETNIDGSARRAQPTNAPHDGRIESAIVAAIGSHQSSEVRIHDEKSSEVRRIANRHRDERLLEPDTRDLVSRSPNRNDDVREQDGHQQKLLHDADLRESQALPQVRRNARSRLCILVVTPFLPSPPRFGGQQRIHALMTGLAQQHEVSLLSLVDVGQADRADGVRAAKAYCNEVVTVTNARAHAKRRWQLAALASPWSYERLTTLLPALQRALDYMLAVKRYDVVQLELAHLAHLRVRVPTGVPPIVCLDEHNIEYEILFRTARMPSTALRRAHNMLDGLKVRHDEQRAWSRVDGCVVTCPRDQETLLQSARNTCTAVVPNGVDVDSFTPASIPREPATLLFFGAIDYYPNTDAVLYFVREVLPHLVLSNPAIKLVVVGRRPPPAVLACQGPNVEVIGVVDDVKPWIARASVVIVPLRIGGGTRLKILEAMAMGKAIVSTSLGAEGLDVESDRHLLIADDPKSFATQVSRVLAEPNLATQLGEAARRRVITDYAWRASVDRLSDFHAELVAARRT
jgi:glycosyltransferase involved in cell wall biosynthesis